DRFTPGLRHGRRPPGAAGSARGQGGRGRRRRCRTKCRCAALPPPGPGLPLQQPVLPVPRGLALRRGREDVGLLPPRGHGGAEGGRRHRLGRRQLLQHHLPDHPRGRGLRV
ncbi:MAG: hypothetical protein AVDCRST_MAG59-3741, partial [uncultured Thermomicrobiales bacterium]